jgi:probable rRNA maturation factor
MPDRKRLTLRLLVETRLGAGLTAEEVERRLKRMMGAVDLRSAELSVVLTNDAQMRKLNHLYRRKNYATDVLAFAMNEPDGNTRSRAGAIPRLLGDVIVSVPTARRQANEADRTILDEVTMLLAHGLLHLLGWDHETPALAKVMRVETERLCAEARGGRKVARERAQRRHGHPRKLS